MFFFENAEVFCFNLFFQLFLLEENVLLTNKLEKRKRAIQELNNLNMKQSISVCVSQICWLLPSSKKEVATKTPRIQISIMI